jgi:hypothetical protein
VKHGIVKFAFVALALMLIPAMAMSAEKMDKTFSVSPGQLLETAQFGFGFGSLQPYIGLDVVRGSVKIEGTSSGDDIEESGSAMIVAPHIGTRWYLGTQSVRPYFVGDFVKSFGFFDMKYEINGTDELGDSMDEVKDAVKSALGFWGLGAGFGCEYSFADNFSVGGEYRFTWLHTSTGDIDMGSDDTMKATVNIEMTGSRVWLNYKF